MSGGDADTGMECCCEGVFGSDEGGFGLSVSRSSRDSLPASTRA
jgi:hypothetical protein